MAGALLISRRTQVPILNGWRGIRGQRAGASGIKEFVNQRVASGVRPDEVDAAFRCRSDQ
jgi:hypothetical protein